ncbi:MAG: 50S ribosomal protein L3 [Candidatus Chisholmbacteria bacterium]|nr:50S ribosomal protein L3 [Candidatus Chisholmbacteria bacterium]
MAKNGPTPQGSSQKKSRKFKRHHFKNGAALFKLGDAVSIDKVFSVGDQVNVTGLSRGRGFAGAMKRWGFRGGPKTHGQSDRARAVGSIGQGTSPGRVHKGKKMPGHFGNVTATVRNLIVLKIDETKNELWLKGQIPGTHQSLVKVKKIGHLKNTLALIDPLNPQKAAKQELAPEPITEKLPTAEEAQPNPEKLEVK